MYPFYILVHSPCLCPATCTGTHAQSSRTKTVEGWSSASWANRARASLLPELIRMFPWCVWCVERFLGGSVSTLLVILLSSLVIFGASIRSVDHVLPCHSDEVHNLVVIVVSLELFRCNESQIDLLNFLPHLRLQHIVLLLNHLLSLRFRFLLKRHGRAAVDAATAATTTG